MGRGIVRPAARRCPISRDRHGRSDLSAPHFRVLRTRERLVPLASGRGVEGDGGDKRGVIRVAQRWRKQQLWERASEADEVDKEGRISRRRRLRLRGPIKNGNATILAHRVDLQLNRLN